MAVISGIGLCFLSSLIVFETQSQSRKKTFNAFNILLFMLCICQITLHICTGLRYWLHSDISVITGVTLFLVEDASVYGLLYCYILYTWLRGSEVLRKVIPKGVKYFKGLVYLSPIVCSNRDCGYNMYLGTFEWGFKSTYA
ncbi:hypothetical protein BCR33DRAFT_724443 [Rhizoclosmatium globosum]|uniref:Uncharacterized protein n=1 Tax=Rhizoclosmatium globosum TaxID=329046 RepID=A0A1Y2B619_9FUNG|nr:hypothetical protein BCR33DRAFT_724443 [Rhizoclosmatium globosum]|eukprot:ORY30136.1 hypothetical protein BCR33DRAFT_724443 [Rhizoclosmatium globosum]